MICSTFGTCTCSSCDCIARSPVHILLCVPSLGPGAADGQDGTACQRKPTDAAMFAAGEGVLWGLRVVVGGLLVHSHWWWRVVCAVLFCWSGQPVEMNGLSPTIDPLQ